MMQDFTQDEYEQALKDAGFKREGAVSRFHVRTVLSNGEPANFSEAAALDACRTLRGCFEYLLSALEWEEERLSIR